MTEDLDRGGHVHTNRDPGAMGAGSLFIRCCGGAENTENSFRHTYTHLSVFASGLIQSSLATEGVKEQTAVDHTHHREALFHGHNDNVYNMVSTHTGYRGAHAGSLSSHSQQWLGEINAYFCSSPLLQRGINYEERENRGEGTLFSHQTLLTLGWCSQR